LLPEPENQDAEGDAGDADESDDDRIIKCPKCKHEFSVLEKKKRRSDVMRQFQTLI